MKQYIKALFFGLLTAVSLVSCNENFEEGGAVTYPEKPELGIYQNEYTSEGGTSYTLNLTLNEAGDTICDVTTYSPSSGDANVFSAGKVSYDKSIGLISADYTESPYETAARVVIAYKANGGLIVNLYSNDGKLAIKDNFRAIKATTISYYGDWQMPDGSVLTLNSNGEAIIALDGVETGKGTYTIDGANVTATVGGKTYALATNAQGQTYVTIDGTTTYVSHIMTQPKEDWYEYALGTYNSWLFGPIADKVLEYSPSRRMARIPDWINQGSVLSFYWVIGDKTVTPAEKQFNTLYTHVQDGQVLGEVYGQPSGNGVYENGVFTFNMAYVIPGVGSFGDAQEETFEVSAVFE